MGYVTPIKKTISNMIVDAKEPMSHNAMGSIMYSQIAKVQFVSFQTFRWGHHILLKFSSGQHGTLDIQIENLLRFGVLGMFWGVQIPSQEVFGCLGICNDPQKNKSWQDVDQKKLGNFLSRRFSESYFCYVRRQAAGIWFLCFSQGLKKITSNMSIVFSCSRV